MPVGFLIFLLPVNFGYENSTVGNLLAVVPFMEEFGTVVNGELVVSAQDQQILNAATTVGLFVSAFTTGFVSDKIGRRKTIGAACVLCIAGIIVQYFSHTILHLFGGKLLGTFGFGLGHSLGPVFVAEMAPVKLRGICLALVVSLTFLPCGVRLTLLTEYHDRHRSMAQLPRRVRLLGKNK